METAKQKICPICYSMDVIDSGDRKKVGGEMSFGDSFNVHTFPIYKCNHCYETFIYTGKFEENIKDISDDFGGGVPL